MKNSKKLLILALSLVLLVAACVTIASAETAEVATVVYPDGSTAQYAEGELIVPPRGDVYEGLGNTLYKKSDAGLVYSVDGTALTDMTVTADLLGKTIVVSGFEKVTFAVEITGGSTVYYTDEAKAGAELKAYLQNMNALGSTTVLYSDISSEGIAIIGKAESVYRLDLNGHKLTLTTNAGGGAFDVRQNEFFLYSSKEGGVLDSSKVDALFRTNDGKYNGIRIDGDLHIGEYDDTRTDYGKNLTVYCKKINTDMYGAAAYLNGGTYVQTANSTSDYLLLIGRKASNESHVSRIRNCTFVVTKANTGFVWHFTSAARTYDNCNFINTSGSAVSLFANGTMKAVNTMKNCNFYGVNTVTTHGGQAINYTVGCSYAFIGAYPERPAGQFYAHGAVKTIVAEGVTYTLDTVVATDTASVMGINWGGVYTDYWAQDAVPYYNASALNHIVENADGNAATYYFDARVDASLLVPVTAEMLGTVVNAEVIYDSIDAVAFSWVDAMGTKDGVALGDKTALEIGQAFYDKFDQADGAYEIKLYADLILPKAMGWGPLGVINTNVPEYKSLSKGSVTLDLNGYTFEISSAIAAGINVSNSDARGSYPLAGDVIFGFETDANGNSFTLKSSRPGAQVLNPTQFALFGVGENAAAHIVIDGANITYIGNGAVTHGYELIEARTSLTVIGGTYVIEGNNTAFSFNSKVSIKDANIILLGDTVKSIFAAHNWKKNTSFAVENCAIFSANDTKIFAIIGAGYGDATPADASKTYSVAFKDCSFIGITLVNEIANLDSLTYEGFTKADTEANLKVAYGGSKPAGTVLAKYNAEVAYGDELVKLAFLCYANEADVAEIVYGEGFDTELYYVGSLFYPHAVENFAAPYLNHENGVYVALEGYKGVFAAGVIGAEDAGKTLNVFDYINYVEKILAFVVTEDGVVTDYDIIENANAAEALKAALADAPAAAVITLFADMLVSGEIANANAVVLDLAGKTLTVDGAFAPAALLTVKNGAIVLVADVAALFGGAVAIEDAAIYNVAAEAALTSATATVTDSKIYNLTLGSSATLYGTVFHTDATASAFGAGVENVLYNNNLEIVALAGAEYEIAYTFAATDDAAKICAVSFVYKNIERDAKKYFVGSIPAARVIAIEGYYYDFVGTEALTESIVLEGIFVAEDGKVMAQLAIKDALNFVYYLQKQDGLSNVVFSGVAQDLATAEVVVLENGLEYYAFTVVFEDLSDALALVSLSFNVACGDEIEPVYAEIDLLDYAASVYEDETVKAKEKELVYALVAYVESVMKYFKKDVTEIKAFNKLYAEYATEFVAPEVEKELASDYVRGMLYIVDEKVSMALRVDPDFKGEIFISTADTEATRYTYKDIVEIDGNCFFILPDLAFCDLTDEYTVEIRMYGEVVETFTYTLADYTQAMTVQNMGYTPTYVKALYTFATLAAAYAA